MIPVSISDADINLSIPSAVQIVLSEIKYFIVEDLRTARRFLKKVNKNIDIDALTFFVLNKHTDKREIESFIQPLTKGSNIGLMSEAGVPGVADPGAEIVALAHDNNIQVVPLTGPSSIVLALSASGLNGQNFVFHGYLPIKQHERIRKIGRIEDYSKKNRQTQIFIETPYRNNQLIKDILDTCRSETKLCIACNISAENEFIKTKRINQWQKEIPDFHKQPAVFLLQA